FGVMFLGVAVFAAIGALSHQRERAFSASLIYLGLGALASLSLSLVGIGWLDPIKDSKLLERVTEVAVVFALFATGLSLDRRLAWREWSTTARLLARSYGTVEAFLAAMREAARGRDTEAFADLDNIAREDRGGATVAGLFLREFVDDVPWVHLDVAGAMWATAARGHLPSQALRHAVQGLSHAGVPRGQVGCGSPLPLSL
ncbi:MAG: leucyl aminopeptidase family protein, partial [Proteobacteria bacterium]|nr:leucyl aminopeptidase family protein [Pseudomonadota bacterium]